MSIARELLRLRRDRRVGEEMLVAMAALAGTAPLNQPPSCLYVDASTCRQLRMGYAETLSLAT